MTDTKRDSQREAYAAWEKANIESGGRESDAKNNAYEAISKANNLPDDRGHAMSETLMLNTLVAERDKAEAEAWNALSRYKFQMFGYWASIWVHLNRISGLHSPDPFGELVGLARTRRRRHDHPLLRHAPSLGR